MTLRALSLSTGSLFFFGSAALAGNGWDWSNEVANRHWRTASLNWASDIHPDRPSHQWIQTNHGPPPKEQWCDDSPDPVAADCDLYEDLLEDWVRSYLDVPAGESLPDPLAAYPEECSSYCTPYSL